MINFEEELKKFHPSLEVEDAEEAIYNQDLTDAADLLVKMMKEAEEKEENSKVANNPLAAVLGSVNAKKHLPPTLTFNADNEMVQTLLRIQGDNKLFQHVVHILYVQSLLQGKYPVNSEEMELFNHSLSELMTAKMNDFINFLN